MSSSKKYKGIAPNKEDYRKIHTIRVVNRYWDIYISEKAFPTFIYWKVILSPESGKYYKSNFSLAYHGEERRLTHTKETESFSMEFPEEVKEWILSFSSYLLDRREAKG